MAPKRARLAAAEADRAVAELEGQGQAETLALASGQNILHFLSRAAKRRNKYSRGSHDVPSAVLLPAGLVPGLPGARRPQPPGACGAAAVEGLDAPAPRAVDGSPPAACRGSEPWEDEPGGQQKQQQQQRQEQEEAEQQGQPSDEEEWEDAWADEEEGEEGSEGTAAATGRRASTEPAGGEGGGALTITLHRDGSEEGAVRPSRKPSQGGAGGPQRRGVTKVERMRAQLVHRAHLLCLLARGLLLDAAASDQLLQAQLLSLVEPGPAAKLHEGWGGLGGGGSVSLRGVCQQVAWVRKTFRLLPPAGGAGGEDPVAAAAQRARGLPAVLEALQEAVAQRRCTGEQLVALFAAVLRAQGVRVRLVHALHPSSLKPTDAARQQERAMAAFSRQFGAAAAPYLSPAAAFAAPAAGEAGDEAGSGGAPCPPAPLSAVEQAAAAVRDLVSGRAAQRVESERAAEARRHGLPDASAVHWLGPQGAAAVEEGSQPGCGPPWRNRMVLDRNRLMQLHQKARAQRKAARAGGFAGYPGGPHGGGRGGGPTAAAAGNSGGGRGRSGGGPGGGGSSRGGSDGSRGPRHASAVSAAVADGGGGGGAVPSSAAGNKRRTPSAAAAADAAAVGLDVPSVERSRQAERERQEQEEQQGEGQKRKRVGDLAEEAELAAALAASARDAGLAGGAAGSAGAAAGESRYSMRGAKGVATGAAAGGKSGAGSSPAAATAAVPAGAATFSARQPDVGQCWVEVFCWDVAAEGDEGDATPRWVHVDPLTNSVDDAAAVAAKQPRERQPLPHVVALAGGGAKDVTQRYAADWLAAEKLRDEEWWRQTLAPLRRLEAAASLAAGAATGGDGSPGSGEGLGPRAAAAARRRQAAAEAAGQSAARLAAEREDAELEERAAQARLSLPSTMEGFRAHSAFVLERHIPRFCAVKPGAGKQGMHRGEPYFRRCDLADLHTAAKWRTDHGREVVPGEVERPYKRVKSRKRVGAGSPLTLNGGPEGEEEDEEEEEELDGGGAGVRSSDPSAPTTLLYGIWQTREWVPVAAADGSIPTNEHGNVEVPPLAKKMPAGLVHLDMPYVVNTCKALGVEHARALVGFARNRFPQVEGVVVWEEDQQRVVDAYLQAEREREERKRLKAEAEADAAWRMLLRAVLARVRLQQSYGPQQSQEQAGEAAMADAAAALLHQSGAAPPARAGAGKKRGGGRKSAATAAAAAPTAAAADVVDLAGSDSDDAVPSAGTAPPAALGLDLHQLRGKLEAQLSPAGQRQQQQQQQQREQHMADVHQEEI